MKYLALTSSLNRFFKSFLFISTLIITTSLFSQQTVSVDDTSYTEEELVNQLVDNNCITESNIKISSKQSVASFNNNGGSFPISKGIIIRTGNAKNSEGSYSNTNLSSKNSINGDSDLQKISDNEGGISDITDVGSLEFNFTPVGKNFSFKYIFASNEYGEFQCEGRDLFAIILTNIETGESFNLTTLPDNTNVSVKNIRNTSNNILCSSNNEALFDTYYPTPTTSSNINMRGVSKVLTASADVIPNNEYKIKFVIGDYGNSDFDSAVFIEAGSFNNTLDLRKDKELCNGENITVDSGFLKTDNFNFVWTKDNTPLTTETGTKIIIDSPGTYGLTITSLTDATCLLRDNIEITTINATQPDDVNICSNNTIINIPNEVEGQILDSVDPSNYSISYFTTESDSNSNANPIPNPTNYQTTVNTFTLWARVSINSTNCFDIVSFNVSINPLPLVDNLPDAYVCLEYILPTLTNGEYYTQSKGEGTRLDVGTPIIVNNTTIYIFNNNTNDCSEESFFKVYIANDFDIDLEYCESFTIPSTPLGKFYKNENGVDEIIPGTDLTADTTVYFYSELNGEVCSEKKFELIITPLPLIDTLPDIVTCAPVTLDPLTNGRYFTGNLGTGTEFFAGDIITSSKNLYIYNIDEESGCDKQSEEFFKITIINPDDFIDVTSCDNYIIPNKSVGEYYTDSSRSVIIPSGTPITVSQTVYYYADEVTTSTNCTGYEFLITINPLPEVDQLPDLINCIDDLPILPTLVNGNYFTGRNGTGTPLSAGDTINSTRIIYIYNKNATTGCDNEASFRVTIKPLPTIQTIFSFSVCEPYTLPTLSFGAKFFTQADGQGTELFPGDVIEETQQIFIYNQDTEITTCANQKDFTVTILNIEVDELDDVKACEFYTLLPLVKPGNYYTNANKTGLLNAGDKITTTQTIYIIGDDTRFFPCQNLSSFEVNVFYEPNLTDLGVVDNIEKCGSLILPSITNPDITVEYYRDLNRTDLILPTEYTITDAGTQTIHVRAYPTENPDCYSDGSFSITVYPLLEIDAKGGAICIDPTTNETNNPFLIESNIDTSIYDVKWYLEGDQLNATSVANWSAVKTGTYTIEATRINPININDCDYSPIEVVIESSNPEFEVNFLSDNFSDLYAIEIVTINEGLGNYTYSLDAVNFQTSNIFQNIKPGIYTVTVRDLTTICNDIQIEFTALNNPTYFNPTNNTWNITDLADDLTATINIFDRYGTLIATIKPSGEGWNGLNNNGNKMPSTDYWYILNYTNVDGNPAVYRSHFSLIRK